MLISGLSQNEQKVLAAHNKYRKIHNAPAMRINTQMSAKAAKWAKHLASTATFEHDVHNLNGDGESLFYDCDYGTGTDPVGECTTDW